MAGKAVITRRGALTLAIGGLALAARPGWALQAGDSAGIDEIVRRFMTEFEIPGVAVAVIRPSEAPTVRGYGVRVLGRPEIVDTDTVFAIASNTKAFTAAALALLVDEGRVGWEDPVVRHLPEFAMHDPDVTRMMTVRDLLVHRSGLPLGAGDLMQFPETTHTREDYLRGLRHLRPARGFRAGYDYDNILYVVAGMVTERLAGVSWEEFVATRLLRPLGMRNAVPARPRLRTTNVAGRHIRPGPPVRGIGRLQVARPDDSPAASPAGGIQASISDLVPWLRTQLALGRTPDGRRLWSEAQAAEMWQPQVITFTSPGPTPESPTRPVMGGYALGWIVTDYRGRRSVSHSGGHTGQVTFTHLLPEQGLGLALLSNCEDGIAVTGLRSALLDHLLDAPAFDWVAWARRQMDDSHAEILRAASSGDFTAPPGSLSLPLASFAGRYRDPWYGDILVIERGGQLAIDFTRTPALKSPLEPWGTDAFRTRFPNGAGEDAIVTFNVENGAVTRMSMRALSPIADFSFDYHHLELTPVR